MSIGLCEDQPANFAMNSPQPEPELAFLSAVCQ